MDELMIEKVPSIGISYQVALHGQRQLVMQSFVGRDCTKDELNALLDKLRNAGERQFAFGQIDEINLNLERSMVEARQQQGRIEEADARIKTEWANGRKRGDPQLTQSQIQKQREAYAVAEGIKDRIESLTKAKSEWEAKLANL